MRFFLMIAALLGLFVGFMLTMVVAKDATGMVLGALLFFASLGLGLFATSNEDLI